MQDNLNLIEYCKSIASNNNTKLAIISSDAKKAFDSIDHNDLKFCLHKYGFYNDFINKVNILFSNLKAKIMINGYMSNFINILQSVKHGDALSFALVIICIDPVIRRINADNICENPLLGRDYQKLHNTAGYADDIVALVPASPETINSVFKTYEHFSNICLVGSLTLIKLKYYPTLT